MMKRVIFTSLVLMISMTAMAQDVMDDGIEKRGVGLGPDRQPFRRQRAGDR